MPLTTTTPGGHSDQPPLRSEDMTDSWLSLWTGAAILLLALLLLCYCCLDLAQDAQLDERQDSVSLFPEADDVDVQLEAQVTRNRSPGAESFHSHSYN